MLRIVKDEKLFFFRDPSMQTRFLADLDRMPERFRSDGESAKSLVRVGVAAILACGILLAQRTGGLFRIFRSPHSKLTPSQWSEWAYKHWWLNVPSGGVAPVEFYAFALVFIYSLLVQNTVNFRIYQLFYKYRNYFGVGFDVNERVDLYGWQPLREALNVGMLSMFCDGLLLVVYGAILSPLSVATWMAPLVGLYLIVLPVFTIVPLRMFRVGRHRAKHWRVQDLSNEMAKEIDPLRSRLLEDQIRYIHREIPEVLYDLRASLLTLVPLGLIFLTLVFTVIATVK